MIVGNYLQQQAEAAVDKVLAAMIISVPWNVFVGCASLETPHLNLMLNRHLADCLVDSVKLYVAVAELGVMWHWGGTPPEPDAQQAPGRLSCRLGQTVRRCGRG